MSDFRVTIKVQNAHLWRAIESAGYESVAEFCRECGINRTGVDDLLAMTASPLSKDGRDWRPLVKRLSEFLGPLPEELFPETIPVLQENVASAYMTISELEHLIANRQAAELVLSYVTPRQRKVLEYRMRGASHREIGRMLDITAERVRQVEAEALRKIRRREDAKYAEEVANDIVHD